jgi:hypothetical protein
MDSPIFRVAPKLPADVAAHDLRDERLLARSERDDTPDGGSAFGEHQRFGCSVLRCRWQFPRPLNRGRSSEPAIIAQIASRMDRWS